MPSAAEDDFPAARLAAAWRADAAEHLCAVAHRFILACGGGGARKVDIAAALQVGVFFSCVEKGERISLL